MSNEASLRQKKKRMKRLKGFITGKSRRAKNKAKSASQTQTRDLAPEMLSENSSVAPDDASTVYDAELDASVMGKSVSSDRASIKSTVILDPVQVILLIMDPKTRRFELLQLEFDSSMAKVSDIYTQIPKAATEDVLQNAKYTAIIDAKGNELKSDNNLSDHIKGAGVVIAVSEGYEQTLSKCASMAVPILTNAKVNKMLISSGIKPEDLPKKPEKSVKASKTTDTMTDNEAKTLEPVTEKKVETVKAKEEEKVQEEVKKEVKEVETNNDESKGYFFLGLLFALALHLFYRAHCNAKSPLQTGSTLPIGKYRHSCGLTGSFPFSFCEPKSALMEDNGILTIFEGDEAVFTLQGKVCGADEEDCIDGAVVAEDGTLLIGGEPAKSQTKPTTELTPFPFSDDVVYKVGMKAILIDNLQKIKK